MMADATLIYDGECGMCSRAVTWFETRAGDRLELLACQDPVRERDYPQISRTQCMESMWLVMADGTRYAGEQALGPLLRLMPRWRWLAWFCELPGVRHASPFIYRIIVRNRYVISALITKKTVDACTIDGDCGPPE